MNKATPIFIPYETKSREFDGKLLLISHLLNEGFYNIFFGSRGGTKREALKYDNGIYIFKSLSVDEIPFYKELKRKNFRLALIHAEGGIHYKDNKDSIISAYSNKVFDFIDINYVFGEAVKNDISKYLNSKIYNKTIVSGNPRFDLLKEKFHPFFENKTKKISDEFKDFILINTSFSVANPVVGKENFLKYIKAEKTYSQGVVDKIIEKSDFFHGVLNDYIEAIKYCANSLPKVNFVIRPHPSESLSIYEESFGSFPNVNIVKKGNVVQWILASKGVIHYDCTTGLESLLANKPVISYLPRVNKKVVAWLPIYMSKQIKEKEFLKENIDKIFEDNFENDLIPEKISTFNSVMHNVKNHSAMIIAKDLKSKYNPLNQLVKIDKLDTIKRNIKKDMKNIVIELGLKKENNSISWKKFENCKKNEVSNKLNRIKVLEKMSYETSVIQLGEELVYIKRKN